MRRGLALAGVLLALGAAPGEASHEGGGMQLKTCVRTAGEHEAYWVQLTAFQGRPFHGQDEYCYYLPNAAPSVLVLDLKGRMQEQPVAIRVARDDAAPLVDLEPRRHTSGLVRLEVPFAEAGHYVASLETSDGVRIAFPLAVGVSPGIVAHVTYTAIEIMKKPNLLILYFLITFALIAVWRFHVARSSADRASGSGRAG